MSEPSPSTGPGRFDWSKITTLADSAPTARPAETANELRTRFAAAIGVGTVEVASVASAGGEVPTYLRGTIDEAETRYAKEVRPVLAIEKMRRGPETTAESLQEAVAARVQKVAQEQVGAERALSAIDDFLASGDLSQGMPSEVEDATRSIFFFTTAYDDAERGVKDDFADHATDVRGIQQAVDEVADASTTARDAVTKAGLDYGPGTPEALYVADHQKPLEADASLATSAARLIAEVETALSSSAVLRDLPLGSTGITYAQALLDDLRTLGTPEARGLEQLRLDFTKVREYIGRCAGGMASVDTETSHIARALGQVGEKIDDLRRSPLLAEE